MRGSPGILLTSATQGVRLFSEDFVSLNGSHPLTADWNAGDFNITSRKITSPEFSNFVDTARYGFMNQTETTIAFDGTKIFTLGSVGASWSYYRAGVKYTITGSKTIDLTTVEGSMVDGHTYYIYIDGTTGALSASTTAWTLLDTKVPVATVAWNNTLTPKYWLGEERHSCLLDRRTHWYEHVTNGTQYVTVGALAGCTVGNDVNSDKTFSIAESVIADEDLIQTLASLPDPNGTATDYVVFYRTGASAWSWKASNMPFAYNIGNTNDIIQYDNAGTMTDCGTGTGANTRWVNSYLLYTNMQGAARYIIIMGQAQHTSLANAQAEAPGNFTLTGLPIQEFKMVYRMTWTTITSTSQGKCRLAALPVRVNVGITQVGVTPSAIDHNLLANLPVGDVHTQYALLAGRSGGQTIYGAPTSGRITLRGESAAGRGGEVELQGVTSVVAEGYNANMSLLSYNDTESAGYLSLSKSRGTRTSATDVQNGDLLGIMEFMGQVTSMRRAAYLRGSVGAAPGASWTPGKLEFYITSSTGSEVSRLTLNYDGDVTLTGKALLANFATALDTSRATPLLYSTTTGGAAYPFLEAGNLIISSAHTVARDIIMVPAATSYQFIFGREGYLWFSDTAGLKDTMLFRYGNATVGTQRSDATAAGVAFSLCKSRGTFTAPTVVTTGDVLGNIDFNGRGTSAWLVGARIEGSCTGTVGTYMPGQLKFSTTNATGTVTLAMTIDSAQDITLAEATDLIIGTATGTKVGTGATQKIGFYGATPIVRPSAYTQTYSTASKTVPALTSATLTDNTGGTATTTLAAIEATYTQATIRNALASLASQINKLNADVLADKKVITALIDDLQALGFTS